MWDAFQKKVDIFTRAPQCERGLRVCFWENFENKKLEVMHFIPFQLVIGKENPKLWTILDTSGPSWVLSRPSHPLWTPACTIDILTIQIVDTQYLSNLVIMTVSKLCPDMN